MRSERTLLSEVELARNLSVGSLCELAAEVDIDEVKPGTPLVNLEMLDGHSCVRTICFLFGIKVTAEVVMQLDVLCVAADGGDEQHRHKSHFFHYIYISILLYVNLKKYIFGCEEDGQYHERPV